MSDPDDFSDEIHALSIEERAEIERMELYRYHRAAGSLGTYYMMYPLDRPPERDRERGTER
jgi:hypothetical protein